MGAVAKIGNAATPETARGAPEGQAAITRQDNRAKALSRARGGWKRQRCGDQSCRRPLAPHLSDAAHGVLIEHRARTVHARRPNSGVGATASFGSISAHM